MLKNACFLFFLILPLASHAQEKSISFEAFGKTTTLDACVKLESGHLGNHDLRCGWIIGKPLTLPMVDVYFVTPSKCTEISKIKSKHSSFKQLDAFNRGGLNVEFLEATLIAQDSHEADSILYYAMAYDTELCVQMISQDLPSINNFFNLYK